MIEPMSLMSPALASRLFTTSAILEALVSQFSCSVVSDSLRPHELQRARLPCPSPTPGVHSDSRPSSQWCHPDISSSVVPFSSCPQSLPASVFSNESTLRMSWRSSPLILIRRESFKKCFCQLLIRKKHLLGFNKIEAFVSIHTGFETDAPCWQVVFLKTDSRTQAPSLFGSATCSMASKVAMIGERKWKVMRFLWPVQVTLYLSQTYSLALSNCRRGW